MKFVNVMTNMVFSIKNIGSTDIYTTKLNFIISVAL